MRQAKVYPRTPDKPPSGGARSLRSRAEPYSQFDLGLLYARGEGVPQDYEEAYFWLDLAACR